MRLLVLHAWDRNRGDEALIRTFVALVRSVRPCCSIDIVPIYRRPLAFAVAGARVQNGRYGEDYLCRSMTLVEHIYRPLKAMGWTSGGIRSCRSVARRAIRFAAKRSGYANLRFLRRYDHAFLAPQGQTLSEGHPMLDAALFSLLALQRHKVPYSILGVSVGPFDGMPAHQRVEASNAISGARRIILREEHSRDYLETFLPGLPDVTTAIDVVFAAGPLQDGADDFVDNGRHRIRCYVKPGRLGACISLSRQQPLTSKEDNRTYRENYFHKMAAFFDHVIERTGKELILLPHIDRDFDGLGKVIGKMKHCRKVERLPLGFDDEDHRTLIRTLPFFISTRYHPTVFAISGGVPFMSVRQHFKVPAMLSKLAVNAEGCWQDDSLSAYIETFERAWCNRDVLRDALPAARQRGAALASVYRDALRDVLR